MRSTDEIFAWVSEVLKQQFQLGEADLHLEARLIEDLDLDSVDTIDLCIRLEEKTGLSFKEEELKAIQTVQDVVDFLHERL